MNRCALSRVEENIPETQRGLRCSPVRQLGGAGHPVRQGMGVQPIVIGHRGHSTIALLQMDSTVTNVVRYVHCPVLVHRPGRGVIVQE
jgi:hypothetical protein